MSIRTLLRYRGWKVWQIHDMHVSLLAIFYILMVDKLSDPLNSVVLILSLGFYFMYGFLINDFFDRTFDMSAGKKRAVHELSEGVFRGLIIFVILISALCVLYLNNISYAMIFGFSYLLATLYSAPVIRFKEKGITGIIVDALIEKTLPIAGIFAYFDHFGIDTYIFLVTSFLLQIIEIMTHQIYDHEGDVKAGIRTFVVDIGKEKAMKIFRFLVVPFSLLSMILLVSLISIKIRSAVFIVALVFIAYFGIFLLVSKGKLNMDEKILPLYMSPMFFLINNAFPLFLALILAITYNFDIVLLIFAIGSQYYIFEQSFKLIKNRIIPRTEIADS